MAIMLQPAAAASRQLAYRIMVRCVAANAGLASAIIGCILPFCRCLPQRPADRPCRPLLDSGFDYSTEGAILLVILFYYWIRPTQSIDLMEIFAHAAPLSRHRSTRALSADGPQGRAQGAPDAGRTREPCVQKSVHSAHARNHRAAEQPALPAQWCYGLCALSPVSGRSSHRRLADQHPRDLIPASGDQDHAFSPYASHALRPARRRVHRIPHQRP